MSARRPAARTLLALPAGLALLVGMDAGLGLLDAWPPVGSARLGDVHGILMVFGFVGTLVALERAVALGRPVGYAAPALLGLGAVLLVPEPTRAVGAALLTAGSLALCLVYVPLWHRNRDDAVLVSALGAVCALGGAVLWRAGADTSPDHPVAGRVRDPDHRRRAPRARAPGHAADGGARPRPPEQRAGERRRGGHPVAGRGDPAPGRRPPRADGVAGASRRGAPHGEELGSAPVRRGLHAGRPGLAGRRGRHLAAGRHDRGGARYDAVVHAVFLGFTISMIMAHASSILPAVTRVPLPYRPVMYGPWGLLQLSLVLRLWGGDALGSEMARRLGGAGNALALLLFLVVAVGSAVRGAPARPRRVPAAATAVASS